MADDAFGYYTPTTLENRLHCPENSGGLGGAVWPESLSRGDLKLIRKAIREDWPTAESMQQQLMDAMFRDLPDCNDRKALAIARTALAAVASDIAAQASLRRQS